MREPSGPGLSPRPPFLWRFSSAGGDHGDDDNPAVARVVEVEHNLQSPTVCVMARHPVYVRADIPFHMPEDSTVYAWTCMFAIR